MTRRVVVTDYTFPDLEREAGAARAGGAEFDAHQCRSAEDVAEAVKEADVAIVQFAPFGAAAARAVKPGATVIRYGVGYNNVDLAAARQNNLRVGFVPDYCTDEVADHTAAMALALLRKRHSFGRNCFSLTRQLKLTRSAGFAGAPWRSR